MKKFIALMFTLIALPGIALGADIYARDAGYRLKALPGETVNKIITIYNESKSQKFVSGKCIDFLRTGDSSASNLQKTAVSMSTQESAFINVGGLQIINHQWAFKVPTECQAGTYFARIDVNAGKDPLGVFDVIIDVEGDEDALVNDGKIITFEKKKDEKGTAPYIQFEYQNSGNTAQFVSIYMWIPDRNNPKTVQDGMLLYAGENYDTTFEYPSGSVFNENNLQIEVRYGPELSQKQKIKI